MKKIIFILLFSFLLFFPKTISAKEVNSFELFWPISHGRVTGDKLYWLKTLKENVRGMLIFGPSEKASYKINLATKRVLEAEKLYQDNKADLGKITLAKAENELLVAKQLLDNARSKEPGVTVNPKAWDFLNKLNTFLDWYEIKNPDSVSINKTVDSLLSK